MYCNKCGAMTDDNATKCSQCGADLQGRTPGAPTMRAEIPNYLVQAILVTIFCCVPFGIPAIVFAAQVNGKIAAGDIEGAMDSSQKAKMWCWLAFGIGLAGVLIYLLLMGVGIFSSICSIQ